MFKHLSLAAAVAICGVISVPVNVTVAPSVDTGWAINTPLKLGQQNCFQRFHHKDVNPDHQNAKIYRACQIAGNIRPDDPGVSIKRPVLLGPNYRYNIHWIPGCITAVPE